MESRKAFIIDKTREYVFHSESDFSTMFAKAEKRIYHHNNFSDLVIHAEKKILKEVHFHIRKRPIRENLIY